jgi:hypothetical protein
MSGTEYILGVPLPGLCLKAPRAYPQVQQRVGLVDPEHLADVAVVVTADSLEGTWEIARAGRSYIEPDDLDPVTRQVQGHKS